MVVLTRETLAAAAICIEHNYWSSNNAGAAGRSVLRVTVCRQPDGRDREESSRDQLWNGNSVYSAWYLKLCLGCRRFVINVPEEESRDPIRLLFQVELAHWFYLDFYCPENFELRSCSIKEFATQDILCYFAPVRGAKFCDQRVCIRAFNR